MNLKCTAPQNEGICSYSVRKPQTDYTPNYSLPLLSPHLNEKCFIFRSDLKKLTPLFRPKGGSNTPVQDSLLDCQVRRNLTQKSSLRKYVIMTHRTKVS